MGLKKEDSCGVEVDYTEMARLELYLQETKIPYRMDYVLGMPSVRYYGHGNKLICDAICHSGSYGHKDGLLEIMGLTRNGDSVEGWLTSREVFDRIREDWNKGN